MDMATRLEAERAMARRDRAEGAGRRGARAARRQRVPGFMLSEDDMDEDDPDGGLLAGMKRRTRRQYDERKLADDAEGIADDVSFSGRVYSPISTNFSRTCRSRTCISLCKVSTKSSIS